MLHLFPRLPLFNQLWAILSVMLGLLVVAVARLTWLQIVVRTPPHYNCDIVVEDDSHHSSVLNYPDSHFCLSFFLLLSPL
uniref:Uncharacterized protein n=2 Tax=Picea TaxID=3328 RepID=A0A101LX60_PICGL|nr:hypothetical protein ABT39_MTgene6003 [Picea glauca]QHR91448.1 hypothetical protein Q903MT_gene5482 [Picea sitchensis]